MHACIVCHEASLTGAPRIGFDIAAFLAKSGPVDLLVKKGGPLIDFPQYAHLADSYRDVGTSHEVAAMGYRERVNHAADMLAELSPDLLYVNSVSAGEWCEAGARTSIPVALHTHETRISLPGLLSTVCTPKVLAWTDLLIGASRQAMDDVEALTNFRVANRLDIGIFIDTGTVLAQAALDVPPPANAQGATLEADSARPSVAMCGLAQHRKGADIFLGVAERLPQYDFVWVGPWAPPETDLNDAIYERSKALELPSFYWTGLTSNPYAHLGRTDALVLTSREDPNPLVVAEALLLGKRVLAFSETGASTLMLERFGYALNGAPDAERIAATLPKILDQEAGPWQAEVGNAIRERVDGARKLELLQEVLERFVAAKRTSQKAA